MINNMKKFLLSFAVMLMGSTLLTGCLESDNDNNTPTEYVVTKGVLVINNGNYYNGIDGSLTFLEFGTNSITAQQNVYKNANGESLGGTPNDVMAYGDKIYITGSDENTVFVLNAKTFKLIEKINTIQDMGAEEGYCPRHLEAYGSNVFVSTYGGYVAVIDTLNLTIRDMYKVGSAPEGMAIGGTSDADVSLYVANSDYGNGNGSPQQLAVAGDVVYVLDWGYYDENWMQKDAGVYMINGSIVSKVVPDATGMAASGQSIVTYNYPYGSSKPTYSIYNIVYGSLSNFTLSGGNPIESPCAINIDPNTGFIYLASRVIDPDTGYPSYTMPGFINIYNGNGQFVAETSYATGVEPHAIVFTYGVAKIQY